MKKVLILSVATGQGHISSARAIKEYFELQNVECEIKEALNFFQCLSQNSFHGDTVLFIVIFRGCFDWAMDLAKSIPLL